jgi:DNA-3-methyladenine glycosylase II
LPKSKAKEGKAAEARKAKYGRSKEAVVEDKVNEQGQGEIDTKVRTPSPRTVPGVSDAPPTPITPAYGKIKNAVLHTPRVAESNGAEVPSTPETPLRADEVLEVPKELPPPAPHELLVPPQSDDWDANRAAPLKEGLSVEVLRSRLAGKKVK